LVGVSELVPQTLYVVPRVADALIVPVTNTVPALLPAVPGQPTVPRAQEAAVADDTVQVP
jgi:hypothetical protein